MLKNILLCLIFVWLLMSACRDEEKEKQLLQREQALLEKEKQFALKETEYQALLKMKDSIIAKYVADSTRSDSLLATTWPADIAGQWSSKVFCSESNCPDYVVGDQRTDTWEFSTDSAQLVAKVINNNKLVRIYTATYENSQIKLHFKTDSAASKQVEMNIDLNDIGTKKIKGSRIVTIDNKCTAKFSVDLTRTSQ